MGAIPSEITAGCTLTATMSGGEYPATAGWTLAVVFFSATQKQDATTAASGADFTVTMTAAQTAALTPGAAAWQAYVSLDGARHQIASGVIRILPDFSAASAGDPTYDPRSFSRRMLESYNQLFLNVSFVKTLQPEQISEIERIRRQFEWDVKREDDAAKLQAGGYPTRKIFTRFV